MNTNTNLAIFKYGDAALATSAKCPHAGGPLYEGDIEVLPDKSLCVKCPWHKWSFCLGRKGSQSDEFKDGIKRDLFGKKVGQCVWPGGNDRAGVKVYPTIVDKKRKNIKIGFDNFDMKTLREELF